MPGFGLPLNWEPAPTHHDMMFELESSESITRESLFPNALTGDLGSVFNLSRNDVESLC